MGVVSRRQGVASIVAQSQVVTHLVRVREIVEAAKLHQGVSKSGVAVEDIPGTCMVPTDPRAR